MRVFMLDEDGYDDLGNLSHLGAVSAVNFDDFAHGFVFQQEAGKLAKKAASITPERFKGIERRIRPHKQRDEGERRLGCPHKPTLEITTLLDRRSIPVPSRR